MNHAVRKTIYVATLTMLMLFGSGCVLVPYSYETVSQEVIGARTDANGKVYEQIIRYDKKLNFFVIGFSPDAKLVDYFGYSRYAAVTKDSEKAIWAMEHFPSLAWTNVKTAVPIPNSDRWITYEYKILNENEVDLTLIIFSIKDGKILRRHFERVKRYPPHNFKSPLEFYIETNSDLTCLTIHETDGVSQINTLDGKIIFECMNYEDFLVYKFLKKINTPDYWTYGKDFPVTWKESKYKNYPQMIRAHIVFLDQCYRNVAVGEKSQTYVLGLEILIIRRMLYAKKLPEKMRKHLIMEIYQRYKNILSLEKAAFAAGVGRKEWVDIAQSNLEGFIKEHGIKNDAIIQTPE